MSKIFISHSSANNAAALAVARWLEQNGWGDYFLDVTPSRGLAPGERWQEALKAAADRCEAVLFLISPAWLASRWCLAEFLLTKQLGKMIFGVLIEPTPLTNIPAEMTTEWQLCDLVAGAERETYTVYQDPIVPQTDISYAKDGLDRLRLGLQRAGLDASTFPWPPQNDPERAPYRGLKALEAEDAAIFFGREASIIRGLDNLRGIRERGVEQIFVILGASGSGKSSYLRAGLLPRLVRDDRHFLTLPVIRPERAVISGVNGLAASLEAAFRGRKVNISRKDIRKRLENAHGFEQLLDELQASGRSRLLSEKPALTVVIPIDQGEELFAAEGQTEAAAFLSLLAQIIAMPPGTGTDVITTRRRAIAIFSIRSESYSRLQTEPSLEHAVQFPFSLPPISLAEYKTVIEGPAVRATAAGHKLTIEPAFTERLLQDTEGADALPLLAFTLDRLYVEVGGCGNLSLHEYEELGGVRGSIEAAIEAAFAEPGREPSVPSDKAERERHLRQGFIPWLASVDSDTEERKRRVARWEEIPVEARPLLERLITQRLLVRDRQKFESGEEETVVEVAHEALLRQWPLLTAWLDEDADSLKRLDVVRRATAEWIKNERAAAWLVHTADRLTAAEALRHRPDFDQLLGADGQAYITSCRERDDSEQTVREAQFRRVARSQWWIGTLLATIAVVLTVAGSWIIMQTRAVSRQTSLVLATAAEAENNEKRYERAMRYSVLASRSGWLTPAAPEGESQLARAAFASWLAAKLKGHEGLVHSASFSPDGRRIVTASAEITARMWDVALITLYSSGALIAAICKEKLPNASHLTYEDVMLAPILKGREGEDVCAPQTFPDRAWNVVKSSRFTTLLVMTWDIVKAVATGAR